jgi:hypothetical protein
MMPRDAKKGRGRPRLDPDDTSISVSLQLTTRQDDDVYRRPRNTVSRSLSRSGATCEKRRALDLTIREDQFASAR